MHLTLQLSRPSLNSLTFSLSPSSDAAAHTSLNPTVAHDDQLLPYNTSAHENNYCFDTTAHNTDNHDCSLLPPPPHADAAQLDKARSIAEATAATAEAADTAVADAQRVSVVLFFSVCLMCLFSNVSVCVFKHPC